MYCKLQGNQYITFQCKTESKFAKILFALVSHRRLYTADPRAGMVFLGGGHPPPPMHGENDASWSKIKKSLGQNWI